MSKILKHKILCKIISSILSIFILVSPLAMIGYGDNNVVFAEIDASPPVVDITSPAGGAVSGTVNIEVYASDDNSISNVEFYIDNNKIGESNVAPYVYSWDTAGLSDGSHFIQAKAYDAANNVGTSSEITVSVSNGSGSTGDIIPPTVNIISPANNSNIDNPGTTTTISADATDNIGVTKVEFYIDSSFVGESVYAPFNYNWITTAGSHILFAKAFDTAGNVGTSQSVNVFVYSDETLTIQPAGSAGKDANMLFGADSNNNYGVFSAITVGGGSALRRGLVQFDLSGIPANIDIKSAKIEMYYYATGSTATAADIGAYQVVRGWAEGTGSGTATNNGATWNTYDGINAWGLPGGDYNTNVESIVYGIQGTYGWYSWDVTGLARGWYKGTIPNYGVLFKSEQESLSHYKYFYSSESGETALRPRLVVTYTYSVTDNLPPTVIASPVGGIYAVPVTINLTADENADIFYTLDGTDPNLSSSIYTAPINIGANTTIKFIGRDTAGNVSAVKTESYTIDGTAPVVYIDSPPDGANVSGMVNITASASDDAGISNVEFYIDNNKIGQSSVAPYVYSWDTIESAGPHSIYVKAVDMAGNVGVSVTVSVTVVPSDTIQPGVTASPAGGIYNVPVNITLSADEPASIFYTLDGTDPTTDSAIYLDPININTNLTLKFFGRDNTGNMSSVKTENYIIDTEVPAVTIVNPLNNSFIKGIQTVEVSASDSNGISKIDLYINNILAGTSTVANYQQINQDVCWDLADERLLQAIGSHPGP